MILYQRRTLSNGANIGSPGPLPAALVGLADVSLADLSWVDPALGYGGSGFAPVVVPDPVIVPQIVSRMQLKRALNQMGLLAAINTAVGQSTDVDLQIYWSDTGEFHRDHPKLTAALSAMGYTSAQADQAFTLAATLT